MPECYPMDATPEEIYAVLSKKSIKLRWTDGINIIDKYLEICGLPLETTQQVIVYRMRKIFYKDAVSKGIGNHTKVEDKILYTTSTMHDDVYRVLRLLRKNGYKIIYPKKEKCVR